MVAPLASAAKRYSIVNKKPYLNLGCGRRYHPEWINIDMRCRGTEVIAHDLSLGIPLDNNSCEVVYHSSLIEHFRFPDAGLFMSECYRVLEPGGIIRVATPDLERICRLYLGKLEAVLIGEGGAEANYDWMMLELYDQAVREAGGGAMLGFLCQSPIPNEAFVFSRIGEEGREIISALRSGGDSKSGVRAAPASPVRFSCLRRSIGWLISGAREYLVRRTRGWFGPEFDRALRIGRFRLSGEVHHWMYDRYSLKRMLLKAGFINPVVQTADRSLVPDWTDYNLDTLPDGQVVKPDSLYMEATKPAKRPGLEFRGQ